ncbi:MAG: hypothetical protein HYT30_00240 [Parcubacteria group bacterium]|nr:hypothetical protein [Parcubacteria group bacterium]
MGRLFNESFLHFVLGFITMLMVSFSITFAINYYDTGAEQTATAANTDLTEKNR